MRRLIRSISPGPIAKPRQSRKSRAPKLERQETDADAISESDIARMLQLEQV